MKRLLLASVMACVVFHFLLALVWGDTVPPGEATGVQAIGGDRKVRLVWKNPTDSDFKGTTIRYRLDRYPENKLDGELVCDIEAEPGTYDSFTHDGLENGTPYYYKVFTYDTSGNYSQGVEVMGTPTEVPIPTITLTSPRDGEVVISDGVVDVEFDVKDFSLTYDPESGAWEGTVTTTLYFYREDLDKFEPIMSSFTQGPYTYTNLTQGKYMLLLRLADIFRIRLTNPEATATATFTLQYDKIAITPVTSFTAQSSDTKVYLFWRNPLAWQVPGSNVGGVLIIRRKDAEPTGIPVDGETYEVGDEISDGEVVYATLGESHVDATGLEDGGTYYYKAYVWTRDEVKYSSPSSTSATLNDIPPARVTDLKNAYEWKGIEYVAQPTSKSLMFSWTAPGADGNMGSATEYIIKYSTSEIPGDISDEDFMALPDPPGTIPTPSLAGSQEHIVIIDLDDEGRAFSERTIRPETTYWVALKAKDSSGQSSPLSNVASVTTGDETPPGRVSDLAIANPTETSLMLIWTSPGDDGAFTWEKDASGHADEYDIRFHTEYITDETWVYATPIQSPPTPRQVGSIEGMLIQDLPLSDTECFFALKTIDEHGNKSELSNVVSIDMVPPAGVEDLSASNPTASTVELVWTAPGDNGSQGEASCYDIRYWTDVITEEIWEACTEVLGEPVPSPSGTQETFIVTGLNLNTKYYFAMKVRDEAGNESPISNVTSCTTGSVLPVPPTDVKATAGDTKIYITWSKVEDPPDIGGYLLYYKKAEHEEYESIVDVGNVLSYTLTGLKNGTLYAMALRSYNTNHLPSEEFSEEVTATPVGLGYQYQPRSIIVPMGIGDPGQKDIEGLRNAYKAIFEHVKEGGNVEWTAVSALPCKVIEDNKVDEEGSPVVREVTFPRGTFVSEAYELEELVLQPKEEDEPDYFEYFMTLDEKGVGNVFGAERSYSLKPIKIALFYSEVMDEYDQYVTWEEGYFERLFRMYLWEAQEFDVLGETHIANGSLANYDMFIAPCVKKGYIEKVVERLTQTGLDHIKSFVEGGGTFYAQGDSVFLAEAAGLVKAGTVDLTQRVTELDNTGELEILDPTSPLTFSWLYKETYILDDPLLLEHPGQDTIARYKDTSHPGSPALILAKAGRGVCILTNSHPANKREYYPMALNAVLLAMSTKAALLALGEQIFNEEVDRDIIPGLEPDIPIHVTITICNFWDSPFDVKVTSCVYQGFKINEESEIQPEPTSLDFEDGVTNIVWELPSIQRGRTNISFKVFTEADALKKGEATVCSTQATYTDDTGREVTISAPDVVMRAKMAARLVGFRGVSKDVAYGVSGGGIFNDVNFPIENKEDTPATDIVIQDLVALVTPLVDPIDLTKILYACGNTNNGTNDNLWITNEIIFYDDPRYPLPIETGGDRTKRFNIDNWDGKTTFVYENPHKMEIIIPKRYYEWKGGGHLIDAVGGVEPIMDGGEVIKYKTTGDLILPAKKLTWHLEGGLQGYDFLQTAIRFCIRSEDLPPDGVDKPRTILLKTLPNIPEQYIINGKVLCDGKAICFLLLLGADPVPYREFLSHGVAYSPTPTNPADLPSLAWKDIWGRDHIATLQTMMAQYKVSLDYFPTVPLHGNINNTFEMFEDKDGDFERDADEPLLLEFDTKRFQYDDVTQEGKKARLRINIKTWSGSTTFGPVISPSPIFDIRKDQTLIVHNIFKGLGFDVEYKKYRFDNLQQEVGNPSQLVGEKDTDMFHILYFQQDLKAGKKEAIQVFCDIHTYPDVHYEGLMKVNEGTRYIHSQAVTGPNQFQIKDAHVQVAFGVSNDVEISKKVAPVSVGNYGDEIYHLIKVEDLYEPRQFELDPYIRSYGFGDIAATLFVGGRVNDKLHYSRLNPGDETYIRIEVNNNLGKDNVYNYNLTNVEISPDPDTVPSWMTIEVDDQMNTIPPIHADMEYLLVRQTPPKIHDGNKGIIYFKVKTSDTIPDADRGKVHKISFTFSAEPEDPELLPPNMDSLVPSDFKIPDAWIGIKDENGNVFATYGRAKNVVVKDTFPDFIQVLEAKLLNEEEQLTFQQKINEDIQATPRGTATREWFETLTRDVGFSESENKVTFDLSKVEEPGTDPTTIPWIERGTESKTFYILARSKMSETTSGIKLVNAGPEVEYKDHFDQDCRSTGEPRTATFHGPAVRIGYEIDEIQRAFNGKQVPDLVLNEENLVTTEVTLANNGDKEAGDIRVEIDLPEDVELLEAEPIYDSIDEGKVIWTNLPILAPGCVNHISLKLSITPIAEKGVNRSTPQYFNVINSTSIEFMDAFLGIKVKPAPKGELRLAAVLLTLRAPEGLRATSNPGWVSLLWNALEDVDGYNIYRSLREDAGYERLNTQLLETPSYEDRDFKDEITYYYTVTAVLDGEEGPNSASVQETPGDIWPPAKVDLVLDEATYHTATLSWRSPGDNAQSTTGLGRASYYTIRYSEDPITVENFEDATLIPSPTPAQVGSLEGITISGLLTGVTYYFAIISTDDAGNQSELSNVLEVTPSPPQEEVEVGLRIGWNLINIPLKPASPYTASSILEEINTQGGKAKLIQRWDGSGWQTYTLGLPFGDFDAKLGESYFVYCEEPSTWRVVGTRIRTQMASLQTGWNLIGIPTDIAFSPTAASLVERIKEQGGDCTCIQAWDGSGWKTYQVGLEFTDFELNNTSGYFIYSNLATKYSPNLFKETNITDTSVTLSWVTSKDVAVYIKFGKVGEELDGIAFDDLGESEERTTHHVTLEGLTPGTTYYYDIVSGGVVDDNNGAHYAITTAPTLAPPADEYYARGFVLDEEGVAAQGCIVYLHLKDNDSLGTPDESALYSTLTDSEGYWEIDLNTFRTKDRSGYFEFSAEGDLLKILVQGGSAGVGRLDLDTKDVDPVPDIVLEK